jgi:hypothetical protein
MKISALPIKRGLLFFWALWFSLVLATNVADGMKALGLLPDTWPLVSGNYAFVKKVMSIYSTPVWLVGTLFALVVLWEGLATLLFWRAFIQFDGVDQPGLATVYAAFAVSLALWAAFIVWDEILLVYQTTNLEAVHLGILTAQLMTLVAIRALPDDG